MSSSFPNLNWARLRLINDKYKVYDMDGKYHYFSTEAEAKAWLAEDEFVSLEGIDLQDAVEYDIDLEWLVPPKASSELELKELMYVKKT